MCFLQLVFYDEVVIKRQDCDDAAASVVRENVFMNVFSLVSNCDDNSVDVEAEETGFPCLSVGLKDLIRYSLHLTACP